MDSIYIYMDLLTMFYNRYKLGYDDIVKDIIWHNVAITYGNMNSYHITEYDWISIVNQLILLSYNM